MTEEATPEVASSVSALQRRKGGRPRKNASGNGRGMHENLKIGGKPPGQSDPHIQSDLVAVRDDMLLARHLTGSKIKDLATEFGISYTSVVQGLDRAKKAEVLKRARDYVAGVLLPKALVVLEKALDEGNVDVAVAVAKGTGTINDRQPEFGDIGTAGGAGDFDEWRLQLVRRRTVERGAASSGDLGQAVQADPEARSARPDLPGDYTVEPRDA